MKRITLAALFLLLASAASAQTLFESSLADAQARAKTENKLILVDFYSYT